ncbi:hypothetical protein B0H16DRAFT_569498 [Mycena metata]|uniref:Uncharacterized protein n=1 Tax=Mycena metata TaxID=1033252 RepID=A0AAD7NGQ9_9AGAR|nr:hypothetical protein B0H16DRAFT_569498 [Mycena metata]
MVPFTSLLLLIVSTCVTSTRGVAIQSLPRETGLSLRQSPTVSSPSSSRGSLSQLSQGASTVAYVFISDGRLYMAEGSHAARGLGLGKPRLGATTGEPVGSELQPFSKKNTGFDRVVLFNLCLPLFAPELHF